MRWQIFKSGKIQTITINTQIEPTEENRIIIQQAKQSKWCNAGLKSETYWLRLLSWTGQDILHRYLSNEGISTITEEEPCYPLPYRGHPSIRGVDHIRGSQCFINADLHNTATIPYQEAASKKSAASTAAAVSPPPAATKQSTSLLGGWLARLRLLSHWLPLSEV